MSSQPKSLAQYIDALEARGTLVFRRDQAREDLALGKTAFKRASDRLSEKNRLVGTRSGFYVIVPLPYQESGAPPPPWYIDDFMKFMNQPYYVGLLSAAQMHGAAHQQPMVYQVVTNEPIREMTMGKSRLQFFSKKHVERIPTEKKMTETGYLKVSTPESTAIDLIRYYKQAGHYHHVATVLTELSEAMDATKLVEAAMANGEMAVAQRLGYLLDRFSERELTEPLKQWLKGKRHFAVPLDPSANKQGPTDRKWKVLVNQEIEPDL